MTNIELAAKVLQELIDTGVREFVICAGARNSPFLHILDENKDLKLYSFFEERSAAFFALGRIASTRRPVAVITTSGTAVAELLPAAVEGTYSSLPLIMVTADRPHEYRGTGAPQTIEQVGIFSYYIEVSIDVDFDNPHVSFKALSWKKPIHVNVAFEEPLIDDEIPQLKVTDVGERTRLPAQIQWDSLNEVEVFLRQHKPLVVVGILPEKAYSTVLDFLKQYKAPVYCEGISCLRGHPDLKEIEIRSGEKMLHHILDQKICDSVLRIGGVPTARLWRDLEKKYREVPVLSVSLNHYTGLSRPTQQVSSLEILSQVEFSTPTYENVQLRVEDEKKAQEVRSLLAKYPLSEQGLVFALSQKMQGASVYLGNSLPIREWDSCSSHDVQPLRVAANRGANGIDGQISTFLGWAHPTGDNWCVVGDLTALYDLSSLWITLQEAADKLRIVIINNNGGQIFSQMFKKEIFINKHEISFESWAKMWNWSYKKWHNVPVEAELDNHQIIELCPEAEQTEKFWKEYAQIWQE